MTNSHSSERSAESRQAQAGGGQGPDCAAAGKDLGAALVIAIFAALTVVLSIRLDVPGSISTAPGLFPLIVGFTLFVMAGVLGWRAMRAGAVLGWRPIRVGAVRDWREWRETQAGAVLGASDGQFRRWANACRAICRKGETGGGKAAGTGGETAGGAVRTALLMAMVTAYVLLVGLINFEFALPLGVFTARISSYEVISVVMVAWILRLFWRAHLARCLIVALVSVEILASIFRYGFGIPMPAGY